MLLSVDSGLQLQGIFSFIVLKKQHLVNDSLFYIIIIILLFWVFFTLA